MPSRAPAAEPGDEALAARAAAGDEPAFEQLVSRYQARAYRLACRLVGQVLGPLVVRYSNGPSWHLCLRKPLRTSSLSEQANQPTA